MTKARDLANSGTAFATVSATELGYLDGTTSAVQTQINTKANSASPTLNTPILVSPEERMSILAQGPTSTRNFDANTQGVIYFSSNATQNWTLNVRSDAVTSLNARLEVGDSITISILVTNGATAYRHTALTIDSSAQTVLWSGGTAPAAGNASSIDAYSFTIIKTASATYTVLGAGPIKYA